MSLCSQHLLKFLTGFPLDGYGHFVRLNSHYRAQGVEWQMGGFGGNQRSSFLLHRVMLSPST